MARKESLFLKGFIQVADPKIWIASVIPMLTAASIAWSFGTYVKPLGVLWFIIAVIGVFLVEIAKNALNEVIDFQSGVDPGIDAEHRTPFSGGKKSIVDGRLDLTQCLYIAIICFILAAIIGCCLAIFVEPNIFWPGLAGFALAVIYSMPPFKLCYRGFGEIAVGIAFGPVIVMGMYVLITGRFDMLPFLVSIPIALIIINVLWINQFPDYEVDKEHGKRNLVVRLGKRCASWVYAAIFILSYVSTAAVALYAVNPVWLLPLLTLPMAIKAVRNCFMNSDIINQLIVSNALTVKIYQLFGLSFIICAVIDGLVI